MFTNPQIQDKLRRKKKQTPCQDAGPEGERDYANRINEGKWPVGKP
jgi:hypothetical protein